MPIPEVGSKAPAFTLLNQDGEKISLKDFEGQTVVLYFYPRAMTPGCTVQACGVRDHSPKFKKLGTVVLAVSPDSPERLKKFDEKYTLGFPLLSDEDHKIAEKYGVWGNKKFMGRISLGIKRTTFVIDPKGKILEIMDKVNTKTHHLDVEEILKK